ncbi:MAG: cation transporter [Bdellovibrionales bacterium]|nr:cation transporter [Bdellovibrionales bacterium]
MSSSKHHDHSHDHPAHGSAQRNLGLAFLITVVFMVIEAVTGWMANSLALIGDAGHMASDAGAILLSLFTTWVGSKSRAKGKSTGYHRAEVLGAFISGAAIWVLAGVLIFQAYSRWQAPPAVEGPLVFGVAVFGLIANLVNMKILHANHGHLGVRAAYLHLIADAMGSIGAIIAGAVLWWTGWALIDPLISIGISLLMLVSSAGLLRDAWSAWKKL